MHEQPSNDDLSQATPRLGGLFVGLTRLQKLACVTAALISLSGAGLWGYGLVNNSADASLAHHQVATDASKPDTQNTREDADTGLNDLVPNSLIDDSASGPGGQIDDDGVSANQTDAVSTMATNAYKLYGPAVFRFGFAFFVGFAIAHALRAAFKLVILVSGVVLLLLVGLQMAGMITIHWDAMEGVYTSASQWLSTQTQSLSTFVRGAIPVSGTTLAGLGLGLTKRG